MSGPKVDDHGEPMAIKGVKAKGRPPSAVGRRVSSSPGVKPPQGERRPVGGADDQIDATSAARPGSVRQPFGYPAASVLATSYPEAGMLGLVSKYPPSDAVDVRTVLRGAFFPPQVELSEDGQRVTVSPGGVALRFGGRDYVELPNTSSLNWKGEELIFPRAVRPYTNSIDVGRRVFNAPKNYVSDVLMGKMEGKKPRILKTLLTSSDDVVYEDPRISTLHLGPGEDPQVVLSLTEFMPKTGRIRNRGVILNPAADGTFEPPAIGADHCPVGSFNMSPEGAEAKNASLYQNDSGQIVLRTRINNLTGPGTYGEQVFVFDSWQAFMSYQEHWTGWRQLLDAGTRGQPLPPSADGRPQPIQAKFTATQSSFPEGYDSDKVEQRELRNSAGKTEIVPHRGFGPGARPLRLERRGLELYASAGKNAPQVWKYKIPEAFRDTFPIADGAMKLLTADHQMRGLELEHDGQKILKRLYSMPFRLWNEAGDTAELLYADAVQPTHRDNRGGGVLDLHGHLYAMGWVIEEQPAQGEPPAWVVWAGSADASSQRVRIDLVQLLCEMSTDSPRRMSVDGVTPPQVAAPLT